MTFKKEKRLETIIYLVLWSVLFMAPVMSLYIRTVSNSQLSFDWNEVLLVWRQYALFFIIFLLHNHLLAPLLVYRQRKWLYSSIVTGLVAGFVVYQCSTRPPIHIGRGPHQSPRHEQMEDPRVDRMAPPEKPPFDDAFESAPEEPFMEHPDREFKEHSDEEFIDRIDKASHDRPKGFKDYRPHMPHKREPGLMFGQHEIISLVILILMLGANLGIKLYIKQRRDQKKLAELEKQNLEQQLEYLRYQINPHFLMNTLNNIHALVDIDPEQAKDTIVELSKMLRFMLYEGNKPTVPLSRELDFLDHYIQLMKLRYTDKVTITVHRPDELPDAEIPPLVFITFVENAFKHGVSYQRDSFIDIAIEIVQRQLLFTCRNSRIPQTEEDNKGGVGLQNVKQRLELLYGKKYSLRINDTPEEYNILLTLPL